MNLARAIVSELIPAADTVPVVDNYLMQRAAAEEFRMLEVGHGPFPVAYQQQVPFNGGRSYTGAENWMRDPDHHQKEEFLDHHSRGYDDQNIRFIDNDAGGKLFMDNVSDDCWYGSDYDPTINLPDGIADEVFISNVFCDPLIAHHKERTCGLAAEIARLVADRGTAILRETITPYKIKHLDRETLVGVGLRQYAKVIPGNTSTWSDLEKLFNGWPIRSQSLIPGRFYMFLDKNT